MASTPLDGVDVVLADLDGVVYTGKNAIEHAVDALVRAAGDGIRVGYITNNASRTDRQVAEHLSRFGLDVAASDVVTSPQAAVRLLAGLVQRTEADQATRKDWNDALTYLTDQPPQPDAETARKRLLQALETQP